MCESVCVCVCVAEMARPRAQHPWHQQQLAGRQTDRNTDRKAGRGRQGQGRGQGGAGAGRGGHGACVCACVPVVEPRPWGRLEV